MQAEASEAEVVPARQLEQTVEKAAEYEPATQALMAVRPAVKQYDPAEHAAHTLNPVDAAKVPAEQLVQLDWVEVDE